jgi:hypothetical protein
MAFLIQNPTLLEDDTLFSQWMAYGNASDEGDGSEVSVLKTNEAPHA